MAVRSMHAPRCQVTGCHAPVRRPVEIQLPMAWEASAEFTVLSVTVGACEPHGFDLDRRVKALLESRSDQPSLLQIIEAAVVTERELREQLAACSDERTSASPASGGGGR
jgi:hypothetical protein